MIPVYNVAPYLAECLDSVINQTLRDIEIICVNDASTDNSGIILDEYAAKDSRITVIHKAQNEGLLLARKTAVLRAKGKYTVFVDSDDYLTTERSLQTIYGQIEREQVDILMFHTETFNAQSLEIKNDVENFIRCYERSLKSAANIISDCVKGKYGWNLWNKIYRSEICLKAFNQIKDVRLISAEDCYAYFLIAYYAQTFKGIKGNPIYSYRLGTGISTTKKVSLKQFRENVNEINIVRWLKEFVAAEKTENVFLPVLRRLEKRCASVICGRLMMLADCDRAEGYSIWLQTYGISYLPKIITLLYIRYQYRRDDLYPICGATALQTTKHNIRTIGIFYHCYNQGGVERVMSLQMPMFLKMGYRVVLITEETHPNEFPLPEGVKRETIRKRFDKGRAQDWVRIIQGNNIDCILHHAALSYELLFDTLLIKSLGVYFLLGRHGLATVDMTWNSIDVQNFHKVAAFADQLLVLTNMDKDYYRMMGVNAHYLPNPIQFRLAENKKTPGKVLLWSGRLDRYKNYIDALWIMKSVVAVHSDAQLIMLGREFDQGSGNQILQFIRDHHLENNVHWLGTVSDVDKYYEFANIFLLTSSFESFGMVIAESKSFGLPLVTYDMPYLEMLKDGKGYLNVPQGDIEAAAEKICLLLEDENLYRRLSAEAKESAAAFLAFDQEKAWREIFAQLESGKKTDISQASFSPKDFKIFMETLYFHYSLGLQQRNGSLHGLHQFNIGRYLRYKVLSKITWGKRRKHYKEKYRVQKTLYKTIKNSR